ncbi:hypothetical protein CAUPRSCDRAFT_12438 [Caulochytrium protostelioides]|uniref:Uncharacterized protein n=1 Tax=Caulochytrium protostelioides TaxID=1555241 RepID=A0A4P9WT67_9FUNG|nr:hypothetical protein CAUPRSCDRAFT_12438 [Caulochytrium protostelioides]
MKRQTILRRRQRKTEQQETVQATAAKLLATRVKLAAVTDLKQQRAARKSSVPSPPCGAASTAPVAVAASPEPSAAHASGGHGLLDIDAVGQRDAKPPGRATSKRSLSTPPPSEPRPLPDVALSKPSLSRGLTGIQAKKTKLDEEFVLPAASLQGDAFVNDPRMATPDDLRDFVAENITDAEIRRLDLDSMAFRALPIEVQHEIVMEMKTKSRHPSKQRLQAMRQQKNALGFSHMQIQHLVDRRKMMETYADFNRTAGVAVNPQTAIQEERRKKLGRKLVPQRIASERGKQYVLIKDDLADGTSGWTMQAVQSSGKAALERAALAQAAAAAAKLPISLLSSSSESDESHDDDETSITYDSDGVPIDRETAAHQLVTQSHLPDGLCAAVSQCDGHASHLAA